MSKFGKVAFLLAGISLVCMSITRYILGEWVPFCWLSLGMAVFFLGAGIVKDRAFFKEFFTMKTTKEGMSMGVLILLMVAVLAIVNYIGVRHYATFDFSSAQSNSLADQSVKIVKSLDSELKVYFFYKKGVEGNEENRRSFRELIKKYQDINPRIQLNFVEVNEQPDLARDFGVDKGSGTAFVEYKGRRNLLQKIDEQEFTSSLVKVTRDKNKTVYFTVGHGEAKLDEAKEGLGLNALKLMLESNRYTVKQLPLIQEPVVPADADVVVIAGPIQNFLDHEIKALEAYLTQGGSLFIALESQNPANLDKLVRKMGIELQNNYIFNVVDTVMGQGINQGPAMGSVFSPMNEITKSFGQSEVTLFRHPQSLLKVTEPPGMSIDELVRTNPKSMAFKTLNLKEDGPIASYALVDQVTGQWDSDPQAKPFAAVIAGDVDFMTNQMLYQNLNRDLVLNSIASLAKEESLISITPKEPQATQLILTETKFAIFLFAFLIPLPLVFLGAGITLHLRRKNA
ncbi:GldG family protein [Bdellovibrio sp. HCB209]|uniref:GldG family protein n=1 Tax=Bdellovibrio sp. HCB209 TaxID=3394354 RepID=UPI0039B673DF